MPTIIIVGASNSGPTLQQIEEKAAVNAAHMQALFTEGAKSPVAASMNPPRDYYIKKIEEFMSDGDIANSVLFLVRLLSLLQLTGEHEELDELTETRPTTVTH